MKPIKELFTSPANSLNLTLALLGFMCMACLCGGDAGKRPSETGGAAPVAGETPPEAATPVTAEDLSEAYQSNEVSADAAYKGRMVEISGKVTKVGKDLTDTIYVLMLPDEFAIFGVQCFFEDSEAASVSRLQPGERVRVRGRCDGKFGNVMVKDSRIVYTGKAYVPGAKKSGGKVK